MRIDYSHQFIKQHKKSPLAVQLQFEKRIELFAQDKFHPLLNNHALTREWIGHRSINITGDWRAIFYHLGEQYVVFRAIGTHSELYGK